MIRITALLREAIIGHCFDRSPVEACGVIIGRGTGIDGTLYKMHNVAERPIVQYRFEPTEQLRVWRRAERGRKKIQAIYHSHTSSFAYPSANDIALAAEDTAWIIVTTSGHGSLFRAFRIIDGSVIEEVVTVERRGPQGKVSQP